MLLLKQDTGTYLVFTPERAKCLLVNTDVSVVYFAHTIFMDGRDLKVRPAEQRKHQSCFNFLKCKCARLNKVGDLPFP